MPAGREAEFQAGFSKFYDATKVHIDTVSKDSGNIFHPQLFVKPFQIMIILKKKKNNKFLQGGKGASGCIYYGFGMHENSVYCREGYAVSMMYTCKIDMWSALYANMWSV